MQIPDIYVHDGILLQVVEEPAHARITMHVKLLSRAQNEPWGQIVTRLLSPEGILVAVTVTPGMRG